MPKATSQVLGTELAVFARNHERHLAETSAATNHDPDAIRTFSEPKTVGYAR